MVEETNKIIGQPHPDAEPSRSNQTAATPSTGLLKAILSAPGQQNDATRFLLGRCVTSQSRCNSRHLQLRILLRVQQNIRP